MLPLVSAAFMDGHDLTDHCKQKDASWRLPLFQVNLALWHRENPEDAVSHSIKDEGVYFIGKDSDCFIIINDKYASRRHASVRYADLKLFIHDEDSINGTLLFRNNEKFVLHSTKHRLISNDIVAIGEHILRIKMMVLSSSSPISRIYKHSDSATCMNLEEKDSLTNSIKRLFNAQKEPVPTRKSLRQVINNILTIDSELDAFALDYYPLIKSKFSSGMDRTAKVNLLLELADRRVLVNHLRMENESLFQAISELIRYE